jgi:uncharacterized membrane protein YhaH (DUF805 family)
MDPKPRSRGQDALVALATMPFFALVAYLSSLEKALLACTVLWAVWVAVSERWQQRGRRGFWALVGLFALVNAIAIWALPALAPFKSGLAVSFPLGIAEGFLLWWLLGRLKPNTR